jgi:hypothetical protein
MVVRVHVRPDETIAQALRRLNTTIRIERDRNFRWYGPMGWMYTTKEYYQKPSFVRRMKRASRKARVVKATGQGG